MRVVARCLVLAACLGSLSFGASALTNADLDAVKRTWNQGGQVQALQQLERSIEDAEANERFESPQVRSLSYSSGAPGAPPPCAPGDRTVRG